MKHLVVPTLVVIAAGLSSCGTSKKTESQRSAAGATAMVIARVDKSTDSEGGTAVRFASTNAEKNGLRNAKDVESAFLSGNQFNIHEDGKVVVVPGPGQHPGQSPGQNPYPHTPDKPIYTPVEPFPGQNPGPCADPCAPVSHVPVYDPCECNWDFPILRAAGRVLHGAASMILWWTRPGVVVDVADQGHHGKFVHVSVGGGYTPVQNQPIVPVYPVPGKGEPVPVAPIGKEPIGDCPGPIVHPGQNPGQYPGQHPGQHGGQFPGGQGGCGDHDTIWKTYAPVYSENGQKVEYKFHNKIEGESAVFYIYAK